MKQQMRRSNAASLAMVTELHLGGAFRLPRQPFHWFIDLSARLYFCAG